MRTYLSAVQIIKVADVIQRNASTFRQSADPAETVIAEARRHGITVTRANLKMMQKALEIDWIFPPKRKPATPEEVASRYQELCEVVDQMDVRLQKIEKALSARGWAV